MGAMIAIGGAKVWFLERQSQNQTLAQLLSPLRLRIPSPSSVPFI
jgi:hypothetical protein